MSLKETQFLLCTNATVYNYKQYNSLWRGNCAAIRKAEHITRHMVYLCVGLWGIIFNALCMLGCLYMITVASLCNLSFYPIEREMPDFATTLLFFTVFLHKFKLLKLIGIICNTSNCLKTTGLLLYILLSCVLVLSQIFPTMLKPTEIRILFKVTVCFICLHFANTSGKDSM